MRGYLLRLILGAVVQPHDYLACLSAVLVNCDKRLGLPRDSHRVDVPVRQLRQCRLCRLPVLRGVQLDDVRRRRLQRVFGMADSEKRPLFVKHAGLYRGRTDVNSY